MDVYNHNISKKINQFEHSSRSHCLFSIWIERKILGETKLSKITLVDLASTERTTSNPITLKEAQFVNKSMEIFNSMFRAAINKEEYYPPRDNRMGLLLKECANTNVIFF